MSELEQAQSKQQEELKALQEAAAHAAAKLAEHQETASQDKSAKQAVEAERESALRQVR